MKRLCIFLFCISLYSCNQILPEYAYTEDAKLSVGNSEWLNYEVAVSLPSKESDPSLFYVVSHLDNNNPYYVIIEKDLMRSMMINKYEAIIIDDKACELSHFTANTNDGTCWYESMCQEVSSKLEYLTFYTIPSVYHLLADKKAPFIIQFSDTTIDDIPYRKYVAIHEKRWEFNNETNEFDIPLQYVSHIWSNQKTNQFDSVTVFQVINNHNREIRHYHIMNLNHDDKSCFIDTIFDFDKPIYSGYSKHTESFPPYSRIGTHNEDINDRLLNFPFIGLQHDTTTIIKTKGWVLLDLWQFGCPPCYQGIKDLQHEKDSLGFSILEQEGITIIAANAKSDNFDLIKEVSEKCGCPDILYAGKGTMSILALVNHAFPSYYLISPEKEIVWRSNYLGNYSELLEAKANYEKQRQK